MRLRFSLSVPKAPQRVLSAKGSFNTFSHLFAQLCLCSDSCNLCKGAAALGKSLLAQVCLLSSACLLQLGRHAQLFFLSNMFALRGLRVGVKPLRGSAGPMLETHAKRRIRSMHAIVTVMRLKKPVKVAQGVPSMWAPVPCSP